MEQFVSWFGTCVEFTDAQYRMVHTVAAAVKSSTWQGSDGIIKEGSSPTSNNDGVGFKC